MEMVQDGAYIKCLVPLEDKPRYITRKNDIATNVIGVCSQDMQFIYVLAGWEGLAADGRVLRDALSRSHGLKVITWLMRDTQMEKVFSYLIEGKDRFEPDEGAEDIGIGQKYDNIANVETSNEWTSFRDNLAQSMFESWNNA
ncbi:hypothetical protein Tco_1294713 [Tanacetum coccineum]